MPSCTLIRCARVLSSLAAFSCALCLCYQCSSRTTASCTVLPLHEKSQTIKAKEEIKFIQQSLDTSVCISVVSNLPQHLEKSILGLPVLSIHYAPQLFLFQFNSMINILYQRVHSDATPDSHGPVCLQPKDCQRIIFQCRLRWACLPSE